MLPEPFVLGTAACREHNESLGGTSRGRLDASTRGVRDGASAVVRILTRVFPPEYGQYVALRCNRRSLRRRVRSDNLRIVDFSRFASAVRTDELL